MVESIIKHTMAYFKRNQDTMDMVIGADTITAVLQEMDQMREKHAVETHEREMPMERCKDPIQVYDALRDVVRFDFQIADKQWLMSKDEPSVFATVDNKMKIYRDRFHLHWQRLMLAGNFVPEAGSKEVQLASHQRIITPVESLIGNKGRKLTFGVITTVPHEGSRRWVLEDLHKVVFLNVDACNTHHLITDGSFVLVEGELQQLAGGGSVFMASNLDAVEAIERSISLDRDQVPRQVFGGRLTDEQMRCRASFEQQGEGDMFVVLSEVHLDVGRVVERLRELMETYESSETPPACYVFMGSFSSTPFVGTAEGIKAYCEGFLRLKFLLMRLPNHLAHGTRFLFVPGPNDPGAKTMPRTPISGYLTSDLAKEVKGVEMCTNPCRLRHYSKELVFFRHDILRLMRKHEVTPLREPESMDVPSQGFVRQEMVRLLFDQAHLLPIPLQDSNILWSFDHSLRLYPLPDAVIIGGSTQPFETMYQGCQFISSGSFSRSFAFHSLYPVSGEVTPCDMEASQDH